MRESFGRRIRPVPLGFAVASMASRAVLLAAVKSSSGMSPFLYWDNFSGNAAIRSHLETTRSSVSRLISLMLLAVNGTNETSSTE
jgi:hypothetical protein